MLQATEKRTLLGLMLQDEFAHLVDGADTIQIAFPLRIAPRKQPMTGQDQTVASRIVLDRLFEKQRQLETRDVATGARRFSFRKSD